jgi:hypothetical protein
MPTAPSRKRTPPASAGNPPRRKQRRDTAYTLSTCVVRLTYDVKQHIISKAKWGESIDQTLRRIFSLPQWNGEERRAADGR